MNNVGSATPSVGKPRSGSKVVLPLKKLPKSPPLAEIGIGLVAVPIIKEQHGAVLQTIAAMKAFQHFNGRLV
jgi:hypothetical protein